MSSPNSAHGDKSDFVFDSEVGIHPKHGSFPPWEGTYRKLLSQKRRLVVELKQLCDKLRCAQKLESDTLLSEFDQIQTNYIKFKDNLDRLNDSELVSELIDGIADLYERCCGLNEDMKSTFFNDPKEGGGDGLNPSDSASQIECCGSTSSQFYARQIELKCKRSEMETRRELELAKTKAEAAKAEAKAEAAKAEAKAEAAKAEAKAEAAKAEAETRARFQIEQAKLEAEEQLLALSERGSSIASGSYKSKFKSIISRRACRNFNVSDKQCSKSITIDSPAEVGFSLRDKQGTKLALGPLLDVDEKGPASAKDGQVVKEPIRKYKLNQSAKPFLPSAFVTQNNDVKFNDVAFYETVDAPLPNVESTSNLKAEKFLPMVKSSALSHSTLVPKSENAMHPAQKNDESIFKAYLDRQGRNEYVNLASQIGYDGKNIAFVFYENQIRKLMNESHCDDRKLEALRASCLGQPREMVNLFLAPMKSVSTSQRIEMALDRLRQRYGVSGGLTTEPKIMDIRHGAKITFSVNSLKQFNEELNTLEVFAYAHDEFEKLSGQLLLDVANRLPGVLKRRYLDYFARLGVNLNRPGFDSLRKFIVHELNVMSSDYAQTFFKSDDKEKLRDSSYGRGPVRVRQTIMKSNEETRAKPFSSVKSGMNNHIGTRNNPKLKGTKPPPLCFVCNDLVSRHFLGECPKFKDLSNENKRQTVIDAGRCLNCLSVGHFARSCSWNSKCSVCGPNNPNKHASALHKLFRRSYSNPFGAADNACRIDSDLLVEDKSGGNERREQAISRKLSPGVNDVLLRTSAVRVINPITGMSSLVYAQHDTGSQVTLISERLKNELDLDVENVSVVIRTLAEQATRSKGFVNFELQSLNDNAVYSINDALVVPDFMGDEGSLPHVVKVSHLNHFHGVDIPTLPQRDKIDILIGQTDKELLAVLEEREGLTPDEPNLVLTRLGPIASGGRVSSCGEYVSVHRTQVANNVKYSCDCSKLKLENSDLKQKLRDLELQDEVIQPSRNEDIAREIVESNIKIVDDRYEIPVPLKTDVVERLPNNYHSALNRTLLIQKRALKNVKLREILLNTFQELLNENWLVPVYDSISEQDKCWYLPFFVSRQDKPRVVFDGAATFKGVSLNDGVLPGVNLLNGLVEVLTRFRLGKYACMADLSKCFFQIAMPREQQDLFRLVWYDKNDIDNGHLQVFRFCRHVWGINSSPYVALFAIEKLINENPTGADLMTLTAIETKRYMDDLLLSYDSLSDLELVSRQSIALFKSRGFQLRKWVANGLSKSVLMSIPQQDLGSNIREIDLSTQIMPDSKALGLIWDVEGDRLRVCSKLKLDDVSTRREMLSVLASQFDPLGFLAPCLLGGKLILQRVTTMGLEWDDVLSDELLKEWKMWVDSMKLFVDFSIPRSCFLDALSDEVKENEILYQLHGFCDASNSALSCVVYLRRVVKNSRSSVSFIQGKSKVVLSNQTNWVISRKELEAAKMCAELMLVVSNSLRHVDCSLHFWTDSQVVLRWIINPDLHLPKFVKRRLDRILQVESSESWNYVNTSVNPADIGTRTDSVKKPDCHAFWIRGPEFLWEPEVKPCSPSIIQVNRTSVAGVVFDNQGIKFGLDKLIEVSADLYTLKKRLTYLIAFKQYVIAKVKHKEFCRPPLTADVFEKSFVDVIWYVQNSCFGVVIELLKQKSSDAFVSILKKLTDNAVNSDDLRRISELKSLRDLRPCVDDRQMLRVDGRLENSELPVDSKHPLILPGSHALTRLIVLNEHVLAGHAGPSYVLMKTRQRFWIIRGISSVKRYLSDCSKCVRRKATPIRQLMADLPVCRVTATNKPFKFSGCDFLGPLRFRQGRSECKAWGLLFTCLCTRCIHVEIVTSLDLNSFLLAFSRFTNLRGNVDTMYSDNGSTFRAAADRLPSLLQSNVFQNSLRKKGVNWVFIPPYSPSQGGSWEIMVKLFKKALYAVLAEVRRMPTLIELQTFTSDAVRIVNDRPLTSLSSEPNDLAALSPSSFLGQQLAPYTPLSSLHDEDDLRRDFRYNMTLADKFWLSWFKGYLPTLQGRGKWRTVKENIAPGQLVLVGDAPDISNRGTYRIGRIHKVHPQLRNGKEIVRRATVAVLKHSGSGEIEYILRDLSKIAPL